jgi:hypothetical protein
MLQKTLLFISLFCISMLFISKAKAENYYVEPLICKGQWNKTPTGYDASYEYATLTVVSFKTVKANDCSLVDSSGTAADFGVDAQQKTISNEVDYLGSWFSSSVQKNGNTVTLPFGVWGDSLKLEIQGSNVINGKQVDTLVGKDLIFGEFYYDLTCEAVVVKTPSHIENNTKNCP